MDVFSFLVTVHIIGTVLGVGGATFAEIFYIKAMRDGVMDPTETGFLKITYAILRTGLALGVLSGFGFLLVYRIEGATHLIYQDPLLAKMTILVLLVLNAILLHMHKIPMRWGASISLVSWYSALIIGSWRDIPYSYSMIIIAYILAIIITVPLLQKIKRFFTGKVS